MKTMMRQARSAAWQATRRAIVLAYVASGIASIVVAGVWTSKWLRSFEDINNWFEVTAIEVPSPQSQCQPFLFYGRRIRQPFEGTYRVRILPLFDGEEGFPVCDNSETLPYTPKRPVPLVYLRLEEFVGKRCPLTPGDYRLEASWVVHREGYWDAVVRTGPVDFAITAADCGQNQFISGM